MTLYRGVMWLGITYPEEDGRILIGAEECATLEFEFLHEYLELGE